MVSRIGCVIGGPIVTTVALSGGARLAQFAAGLLVTLAAVLLIGEAFARLALPKAVGGQLEPDAQQPRIYRPDPQIGADFRSFDDFRKFNAAILDKLGPLDLKKPTWLLFGNSFVQGPGHLADTAERTLPDTRIVALRRFVELPLRAAEARQLLANGLRPQRIFFVMLPIDTVQVGRRPLSFIDVRPDGAFANRMRWPDPPWTSVVTGSRLATIAWIRSGRAGGDLSFDIRRVSDVPSLRVQDDLSRILNHLAETSRRYRVPVTVVAVPNRDQVFGRAGFGFQDTLAQLSQRAGLDFLDVRQPFVDASDKLSLFVPDWHFTGRGNALLVQELVEHDKRGVAKSVKLP
jgi:hypothetical protein